MGILSYNALHTRSRIFHSAGCLELSGGDEGQYYNVYIGLTPCHRIEMTGAQAWDPVIRQAPDKEPTRVDAGAWWWAPEG